MRKIDDVIHKDEVSSLDIVFELGRMGGVVDVMSSSGDNELLAAVSLNVESNLLVKLVCYSLSISLVQKSM